MADVRVYGVAHSEPVTAFFAFSPLRAWAMLAVEGDDRARAPGEINERIARRRSNIETRAFVVVAGGEKDWLSTYLDEIAEADYLILCGDEGTLHELGVEIIDEGWRPGEPQRESLDNLLEPRFRASPKMARALGAANSSRPGKLSTDGSLNPIRGDKQSGSQPATTTDPSTKPARQGIVEGLIAGALGAVLGSGPSERAGGGVVEVMDDRGRIVGRMDQDGVVTDPAGERVGHVDDKGYVHDRDSKRWFPSIVGRVDSRGTVIEGDPTSSDEAGYVDSKGNLRANATSSRVLLTAEPPNRRAAGGVFLLLSKKG